MVDKDFLSGVELFKGLPEAQLANILQISTIRSHQREELIFSQEDEAEGFYIVVTGRVKVFKLSSGGKEQILHLFGPKEPFGEVPVFSGGTFPAYAQALEDSDLLFLPRDRLRRLFRDDPSLAMNMLAVLAGRLRRFAALIEDLSLKELPARLATYLVQLQDAAGGAETVALEVSKGNLARILGASPETLSRVLKKMAGSGIIEVDKKNINILNSGALEDIAEGFEEL